MKDNLARALSCALIARIPAGEGWSPGVALAYDLMNFTLWAVAGFYLYHWFRQPKP